MRARTYQRCLAVLAILHESDEHHPAEELCTLGRFAPGTLYDELAILERDKGLIVGYGIGQDGEPLPRRYYRLTTKSERAQHALLREAGKLAARPVRYRRRLWGGAS